jgi:ATP-dependent phosphofructokinase / diphosphate-dependent phosphofructokinase
VKKLLLTTGGGDAPGLNAVIYAAVHTAERFGFEIYGVRDSYDGILHPDRYPEGGVLRLDSAIVRDIPTRGGTFLGTTNRGNPFREVAKGANGQSSVKDRSDDLIVALRDLGISVLISVGGDGSLTIAHELTRKGISVIGVPKTIDNDLEATDLTFGFQTAVSFASECIERLHTTAEAHRRVLCVEVMGRHAGWIALHAGIASLADAIVLPEIPFTIANVAAHIRKKLQSGQRHAIVVVAEGAAPISDESTLAVEGGSIQRLGGIGDLVARALTDLVEVETRSVTLGHLLRGGSPIAIDRILGFGFGVAAVQAAADGLTDVMVALQGTRIIYVPLADAIAHLKLVPPDAMAVRVARALDISLGDAPVGVATAAAD